MKRIEQLRAWLFPLGVILLAAMLLFSITSPLRALLSCLGGAALLSTLLWALSVHLAGGRRPRALLLQGAALLHQASSLRHPLSAEDTQTLYAQREALLMYLKEGDMERLTQAIQDIDKTLSRITPSSLLRELLVILAVSFLFASFLKSCVVEPFHIPSGSMYPTLHIGDHIFVNKFIYGAPLPGTQTKLFSGWRLPRRGEVIVFRHDADTDYIKRVIALPGDVVDVTMDRISINGVDLPREYLGELSWRERNEMTNRYEPRESNRFVEINDDKRYEVIYDNPPTIMPSRHLVVPPGEYMVLGDNRDHSFDSLHWGFVPLEKIMGRAMFIAGALEDNAFRWDRLGTPIW